jgi:hypothetical protein
MIADKNEVITLAETLKQVSQRVLDDELKLTEDETKRGLYILNHMKFVKACSHFIKQSERLHDRINALNAK